LGLELSLLDGDTTDETALARIASGGRCDIDDLRRARWVEHPYELPAGWVEHHLDRLGGWRLAPPVLVDQLARLEAPAPLVLVPRRQSRHLNSQLDFLGEVVDVILHPDDARAAGVADGDVVVVCSEQGTLEGYAKVDASVRAGTVSVPHGHQGVNVNSLTCDDDIDATTGMAHYSGVPVTVRPAAASRR